MLKYVARKNIAIAIGVIFFILILVCIIWLCAVVTDYIRYKTNTLPIFAYNVVISDLENGYIEEYTGFGYKYVEQYIDGKDNKMFYLFGLEL